MGGEYGRGRPKYGDFSDLDLFRLRLLPADVIMEKLGAEHWGQVGQLYARRGVSLKRKRAKIVEGSVKERCGIGVLIVPARLGGTGCESEKIDERFGVKEECPFKEECRRQFEGWGVMACEEIDEEEAKMMGLEMDDE